MSTDQELHDANMIQQWKTTENLLRKANELEKEAKRKRKDAYSWQNDMLKFYVESELQVPKYIVDSLQGHH